MISFRTGAGLLGAFVWRFPAPKKKGGGTILLLLLCCCYRPWCLAVPHAMSPGPPSASEGIPHLGLPNTKSSSLGRGTPKNGRPIHSLLVGPS